MCCFFSAISDGRGDVKFFTVEQVAGLLAEGNPKNYEPNSHTSIADYNGIKGADEDKQNKWEYDVDKKVLEADKLAVDDDSGIVKEKIEKYLAGKNLEFLRNLYGLNSGNLNSGNRNSGNRNSGNRNSGSLNSGDLNSGYRNSGYRNSGNQNSGDLNSGTVRGHFCSGKLFFLFNKKCTETEAAKVSAIDFSWFKLVEFICEVDMSEEEKAQHPTHKTTGGYLKTILYKDAWKACPKEVIEKIKKLKNFNKKVFFEISGLKV